MGRSHVRPHSHQRKCHSGYCSDFCEGKVGIGEKAPACQTAVPRLEGGGSASMGFSSGQRSAIGSPYYQTIFHSFQILFTFLATKSSTNKKLFVNFSLSYIFLYFPQLFRYFWVGLLIRTFHIFSHYNIMLVVFKVIWTLNAHIDVFLFIMMFSFTWN